MIFRAVIFDVYGTLLELGSAPNSADEGWKRLLVETLPQTPPISRSEFSGACATIIAREQDLARSRGILYPEIVWPSVVGEVLPEFLSLPSRARDAFILRQTRLNHTTSMNREAALLLASVRARGCYLGLASNAQAYTVEELRTGLASVALELDQLFKPSFCFWSYEFGFSKPAPHVFQLLTARLQALNVRPGEILMVGDRLDNDIEPALQHGWNTWWLTENPGSFVGGGWSALSEALE